MEEKADLIAKLSDHINAIQTLLAENMLSTEFNLEVGPDVCDALKSEFEARKRMYAAPEVASPVPMKMVVRGPFADCEIKLIGESLPPPRPSFKEFYDDFKKKEELIKQTDIREELEKL